MHDPDHDAALDARMTARRLRAYRKALEKATTRRVVGRRPDDSAFADAMTATAGDVATFLRALPALPRPGGLSPMQYQDWLRRLAKDVEDAAHAG